MLVKIERELHLCARREAVWAFLRDVPRLAALIPNVRDIVPNGAEGYVAHVNERLGPFQVEMALQIRLLRLDEPEQMEAEVNGSDRARQNWVRGTMVVHLAEAHESTRVQVRAAVEVLGRLASVGAAPIRRRAEEIFAEVIERLQREFAPLEEKAPREKKTDRLRLTPLVIAGACGSALGLSLHYGGLTLPVTLLVAITGTILLGIFFWRRI